MRRMFTFITCTWNPIVGCLHNCVYCWARKLAETKLKNIERYKDFNPKLIIAELGRKFATGTFVFISDMGDWLGEWVKEKWIKEVIETASDSQLASFLSLTKNPDRYFKFFFPESFVLGTTVETNRDSCYSQFSKAPLPSRRLKALRDLRYGSNPVFMAIEPIMDFDLEDFSQQIIDIHPWVVAVGYDNYNNNLLEPSLEKTKQLIAKLEGNHIRVFRKTIRERREYKLKTEA
jgi:DNA repair photolyase